MACFFVCGGNNIKPIKIDHDSIRSGVVISPTVTNHIEHCAHCIKKYKSSKQIENGLYLSTHLEYSQNMSMDNILTNLSISPTTPQTPKTPTIDPGIVDSKQIIKYSPTKSGIYTTHSPNSYQLVEISPNIHENIHEIDYFPPSKSKKKRIKGINNINTTYGSYGSYPIAPPNTGNTANTDIPYHISIIQDVDNENDSDLEGIDDDDPIHLYAANAPNSPIFADKNNNKESKYKPPPTHRFNRFCNNNNLKVIETINAPSNSPRFYPKVIVEDEEHNITIAEFRKLQKKHQKKNNKLIKKLEKIKEIEYDEEYRRKSKRKHKRTKLRKIKSAKLYHYKGDEQHLMTKKKSKKNRIHHVHEHHHHHHHHQIDVDKLHKKKKRHKHLTRYDSDNNEYKKTTKRGGGDSNGFFTEKYKAKYDKYFDQTKQYEIDNMKTRKGLKLKRMQTSPIICHYDYEYDHKYVHKYDHKYDYDFDEGIDYKTRNKLRMNNNIKTQSKDTEDLLMEFNWNKKPELRAHSYSCRSHQSTNT